MLKAFFIGTGTFPQILNKILHHEYQGDVQMNQALPVSIQTMRMQDIYYPQVIGLKNMQVQQMMNQEILRGVQSLIDRQHQEQDVTSFEEIIGLYEIKTNERNILSLTLTNYAYAAKHANGLSLMDSATFDVQTGKSYQLKDLFKQGSNYTKVLSDLVEKQIKSRDIPILNSFPGIAPDQPFYIADKSLVLYYQPLEITAHYFGFPIFPISVYDIQSIIKENGPLDKMLTND